MSAEVLRFVGLLALGVFLLDVLGRLVYGAWLHEAPQHKRAHQRHRAALVTIAGARLTPDEHTAQATEAQWLRALARNALDPARMGGADPEIPCVDAHVGHAIRAHQAALAPEEAAEQRPPAGAS